MTELSWRIVLVIMTLVGFGLTAGGLIAAVVSAFREVEASRTRVWKSMRLAAEEKRATAAIRDADPMSNLADNNRAFMRKYAAEGLIRPSWANSTHIPAREARRVILLTLQSALVNLVVAGIGLVVSTSATVIALIVL